jgi:hypothetical protein
MRAPLRVPNEFSENWPSRCFNYSEYPLRTERAADSGKHGQDAAEKTRAEVQTLDLLIRRTMELERCADGQQFQ